MEEESLQLRKEHDVPTEEDDEGAGVEVPHEDDEEMEEEGDEQGLGIMRVEEEDMEGVELVEGEEQPEDDEEGDEEEMVEGDEEEYEHDKLDEDDEEIDEEEEEEEIHGDQVEEGEDELHLQDESQLEEEHEEGEEDSNLMKTGDEVHQDTEEAEVTFKEENTSLDMKTGDEDNDEEQQEDSIDNAESEREAAAIQAVLMNMSEQPPKQEEANERPTEDVPTSTEETEDAPPVNSEVLPSQTEVAPTIEESEPEVPAQDIHPSALEEDTKTEVSVEKPVEDIPVKTEPSPPPVAESLPPVDEPSPPVDEPSPPVDEPSPPVPQSSIPQSLPDLTQAMQTEVSEPEQLVQKQDIVALAAAVVRDELNEEMEDTSAAPLTAEEPQNESMETDDIDAVDPIKQEVMDTNVPTPIMEQEDATKAGMMVLANGTPESSAASLPDLVKIEPQPYDSHPMDNGAATESEAKLLTRVVKKDSEADDLATLANAALTVDQAANDIKDEKKEPLWYDVGFIKGTNFFVKSYYEQSFGQDQDHNIITSDNLPDDVNTN